MGTIIPGIDNIERVAYGFSNVANLILNNFPPKNFSKYWYHCETLRSSYYFLNNDQTNKKKKRKIGTYLDPFKTDRTALCLFVSNCENCCK